MHWVACLYYTISEYEGLGTNDWVYTETEEGGDCFIRSAWKITYINTSYLTLGPFCKLRTEFLPPSIYGSSAKSSGQGFSQVAFRPSYGRPL